MPEVSVVIPLYNKGPYIARALNSVLAQTFQDFEVIVVDDGSTDDGAAVVRGFDDPRIRLIQQENQGVSAARNRGIEVAQAELVAFLDADDEWLPRFLETIIRLRTRYPDAGLYGTAYKLHYPGSIVKTICIKDGGDRLLSSYFSVIINHESNKPHYPFNSSSFAAPKNVLLGGGGFPLGVKWNEDVMLWGVIALQFSVAYSPDVCSIIHRQTANDSSQITEYLESPFPQYVSTISKDELLRRDDVEDLTKYCDYLRLAVISRNIYSGHGVRARRELSSVKSPHWTWKKYKLQMLSYIPQCGMRLIRNHAKTMSYLKRKTKMILVRD